MKFNEMTYSRPDVQALSLELDTLREQIENAKDVTTQITAYDKVDKLIKSYQTMGSLAYVRHTINTKDDFYDKENDFFDENGPVVEDLIHKINTALLKSPFIAELKKHYGKLLFLNTEISLRCFSSEIVELAKEENKLQSDYQKLFASATVSWEGKTIPLTMLGVHKQSADRNVRKEAFLKDAEFFENHKKEFDDIYDRLIKNRNKQARILGYDNFIQMGYDRLGRNCYSPREVTRFREQIVQFIVPVVSKLREAQKNRIGVEELHLYDNDIIFKEGNVKPKGSADDILKAGFEMYSEMNKETAEFIKFMFDNSLFDVLSREGKAPGGYCTEFADYKAPFIFSNFNGTAGDVDVLTHEAGHAFAYYTAAKKGVISAYTSPTIEACEVHSMSMEFLTAPHHSKFFGEDTPKYEYYHLADALNFIPYGCMVDEFQHLMYENEALTPYERKEVWLKLEKKYRPHLHLEDLPFYKEGGGWQRQLHIYLYPLYYIDYCMAQTVAFQFFTLSLKDYNEAFSKYLEFVEFAGTKTFEELVKAVGLKLPYEEGCLKETAKQISNWLEDNSI
ncbi:MAG: M3 family oligoendopeptidase [Clostridia bacterium]|nr:M3 family oligoendopeptidase [Clostridia bacterium]